MVYWAHLLYIPSTIINSLNRMTANFIWGGNKEQNKYHLSKLYVLVQPKKMGGWGILDLTIFRKALLCKSMWKAIMGKSFWSMAIRAKYMDNKDLSYWFRENNIGSSLGSAIWRGFRKLEPFFRQNLIWKFQTGSKIMIGWDEFARGVGKIHIST